MTPSRPYLVRAIYEWLVDNNATPYILIDATHTYSRVPQQHVKDGKIVLNVAPHAVKDLLIGNEGLSFSARFGGVPTNVSAPMVAVLAIYARENGQGMFFDNHDEFDNQEPEQPVLQEVPTTQTATVSDTPKKRPTLTVVK
ncbi:MAG: ClpXP protease specificity-enhancing factor [Moraxellaceae bacterium]|nr:ClpXP protease specificity-enhancing factor [Pseudomonadales bacterium]MCP5175793.1 ClpXP protease specificity-enhancing factor [Moraxellaceae bacterium]MCP5176585.1 ClpXP protease specificity-enhancing factor [Moraxellaceae bacterium]HQV22211.1 ClpXP protease specificity-enhancing factor [Agitococcus sp.]